MEKAVVIFSGGQDSTTCLLWALEKFDYVETITFLYGQRNISELDSAEKIANDFGVKHTVLNLKLLSQLTTNAMTRMDMDIDDSGKMPNTFVPGRNHIFLSFAAIYAKQIGARHLITGVSETDFSGYPDCRHDFIQSLNQTLNLAMDDQFHIHTPLMWKNKAETWEMADRMGRLEYIKVHTTTCYNGIIGDGCGSCPSCKLRKQGLDAYLAGGM
ncbi:7-cyano-7-deazaguanine synthase QueC [Oceanobacillus sp. FSL H7-0719]|uniref:7-cyano-7-deazaguanine synthase QueC n=1 Tax=Oceanobacillus sp. FSL H7-0719 TaxID=2954507 RepID=UPI003255F7A3